MADHISWFQPEDFNMDPTVEEQEVAMSCKIARDVLNVLFDEDSGDDLGGEPSGSESSEDEDKIPQVLPGESIRFEVAIFLRSQLDISGDANLRRKRRLEELLGEDKDWYPWPDKIVSQVCFTFTALDHA
jgi:hypothetical protein